VFALRNLLRRRVRTALTVLGAAMGVATVVALVSVSRGFQGQFDAAFAADEAHLVLTQRDAADPFLSYLPESLAARIAEHPAVAAAHPFLWGFQQVGSKEFLLIFGVTEGSPFLGEQRVVEGEALFDAEPAPDRPRTMMGVKSASQLRVELGDEFDLRDLVFDVVGLFEGSIPLYEGGVVMRLEHAQRVCGQQGNASAILLQLEDASPAGILAGGAMLEEAFPEITASEPATLTESFDEFELTRNAVRILSILAVLIGGIGVMNTMLMSVFERTREIGVLQAIGWSKAMVLRQILVEGVVVCLVGGVLGVGLGVGAVEAISNFTSLNWVAGDYGIELFLTAIGVAALMGAVGSAYPAYRALRITPIAALSYE